ncbi:MAG: outer membrane protein transport protein [Rikenellaceae bacterium]
MKKFILLTLAAAVVTSASAEGYQVNTLSAKQLGMAHTGVSQKLNSESVWFNPAAAAYQDQKFTIAGGVTGINAVATWSDGAESQESDNKLSTPLYLNANYKVNDNLAVGLVFNVPFGSSMNWGENWAGMDQVQSISLQSYNIQPTVSYKMLDGKLSVGAGLMISWGSFELTKSLQSQDMVATIGACNATLSGDADMSVGYNIGAMYDINEKWSIGASYRSEMKMAVSKGKTELDFDDSTAEANYSAMESNSFSAELPMPSTLSVGATFRPTDKWNISLEIQRVGWSAYKTLEFDYSIMTVSTDKDYDNTMIYRIGGQYEALEWLTARAGFYYDESPVQDEYFSPETPSMNKLGYTCGVSIMPCASNRYFSIDLAYAYIAPAGYNRTSTFEDFGGKYRAVANVFSVGASWGF